MENVLKEKTPTKTFSYQICFRDDFSDVVVIRRL